MSTRYMLLSRLLLVYFMALLAGTLLITMNNIVFYQIALSDLLHFHIPFLLASDLIFAFILLSLTWWRLHPFLQSLDAKLNREGTVPKGQYRKQANSAQLQPEQLFTRMLRFPYELFASVIGLALIFMLLFHGLEIWHLRVVSNWNQLLVSISSELSLASMVAMFLLIFSKSTLRNHLLKMEFKAMPSFTAPSLLKSLYVVTVTGFAVILFVTARVSGLMMEQQPDSILMYIVVLAIYVSFVLLTLFLFIRNWRRDLAIIRESLWRLSAAEQTLPLQGIPVFTNDETASLAAAFNQLQAQLSQMHSDLAQQLALARDIQSRLLPTTMPDTAPLQVAACYQPCYEVGGDFYDVIKLDEQKLVVAIGDVSGKGMSAAMLMSAMLAALRAEVVKGGSAGEVLTALNKRVYELAQGQSFVTLGLAIIKRKDRQTAAIDYASAGHMAPYMLSGTAQDTVLDELDCAALPLGVMEEQSYSSGPHLPFSDGQMLIMYTDGIVEAIDEQQQLFGFERWEQELRRLDTRQQSLSLVLQQLLQHLPHVQQLNKASDDRTIVLIHFNDSQWCNECDTKEAEKAGDAEAVEQVETAQQALCDQQHMSISSQQWFIEASFGNEKLVMSYVAKALHELRLDEARIEDVQTVLAEACINAIEYGDQHSPITIGLHIYRNKFAVEVMNAASQRYELPQQISIEQQWEKAEPRGWGLLLMRQLCDEISYGYCAEGFYIRTVYYMKGGA